MMRRPPRSTRTATLIPYTTLFRSWPKSFSCYYSGNFTTGFRHGYVQKIYASIRAADPPSTGEGAAIGVVDRRAARIAAPAAPAPVKSLDAARIASTWPATSRPGNARSEEHTSELQSLMRNSYAVFCL